MTPTERRQHVADCLGGIMVPGGSEAIPVHAGPLDNATAPSIVIGPRGPYIERVTFRQYRVNLTLTILLPRAFGDRAMDVFDAVFLAIMDRLPANADVLTIGNPVGVVADRSGIEYMSAAMDIAY